MTTFYICRHGQTENNKNHRLSGWVDTPLTDEGIKNALSSASKLSKIHLDKIISSDLGRAFTTAYIISKKIEYIDEIERYRDFREVNYGEFANMPYEAYPELTAQQNTNFTPKGGESLAVMQNRVLEGLATTSANNPDKTILLVGHDGTINAIYAKFCGKSIGLVDSTHNPHDFVAKVECDRDNIISFEELVN